MLRIAICDDLLSELTTLEMLTKEFAAANCPDAEIITFSHPDALYTACESTSFHIYLLDIVMPMLSGLDLGRSIRRISTDAQIIYITTEPGYALDAYAVNPLHYLLKPVDKTALFSVLNLAAEKMDYGAEHSITVKTREGLRTLSADSIMCCEYVRHNILYTLSSGERVETSTIPGSFSDYIAPLLLDKRFIHPHAAFAVNMSFVERLDKTGFSLRGGVFVPVSGKQYAAVRNAYTSYRLGAVCPLP